MEQTIQPPFPLQQFPLEDLKESCEEVLQAINTSSSADYALYDAIKSLESAIANMRRAQAVIS